MHPRLCLAAMLAATALSSLATAQIPLPPHTTIYNGFSRGFNFTSSIPFTITGLDLPIDAFQAGDTASYLVIVNGSQVLHSFGNAGMITTSISIVPGDVVDIIGNWSPAAPGNFTAHNSYGGPAPYATTIEGVAHTLNRVGWQWDVGDPTFGGTAIAPAGGNMGRIDVFTAPVAGTVATNTATGDGCIQQWGSWYEFFPQVANFDMTGAAITMIPNGSGSYVVTSGGSLFPVGAVTTPVGLTLADDAEVTVPFTTGAFNGPNGPWTGLSIISNGKISEMPGNSTVAQADVALMLDSPNTAFYSQADYDPTSGGSIWIEETPGLTVVTWENVPSWNEVGSSNTFQMQFEASGTVTMAWGAMAAVSSNGGILIGYSPGGPNGDPGSEDMSTNPTLVLDNNEIFPLTVAGVTRPILGTSWDLEVTNVPATGVIGADIYGLSDPGFDDLTFLGMPTCGLRASLDVLNTWLVTGPTHTHSVPVPNTPSLISVEVHTTSAVFQVPAVNAFGAITANGITGTIGDV